MEVKIIISDTAGGGPGANSVATVQFGPGSSSDANVQAGPVSQATGLSAAEELLQRAAAIGAINAGPAPNLSGSEAGAPMPFINVNADMAASAAGGQSAGAAPGSGSLMETFTVAHRGDE